jgi:hypothetical protein
MKGWPDPSAEVAEYFPESMDVDVMVAVVGNGHGWGDMYTRPAPVDPSPADEASRLRGANAAVINAVLVAAQYGGLPAQQAASALGVLEHEMFHVLLHTYAQREATWQRWPEQPSAVQQLQWTVLDEGIAHFVDARAELIADGFPGERAETALQRLAEAATALERPDLEDAEREDLLRSAHQGRYWDKFASIAGMLMAYGVYREVGMEGIHRAVRCGPGALAASYASAAAQTSDLPALPEPLVPWTASDLCF